MTLDHKPLEAYFRRINHQKELTMFEALKSHFSMTWGTKPAEELDTLHAPVPNDDCYSIEMFTSGFTCDGEDIPAKYTKFFGNHVDSEECTWIHLVDKFADMLSYHYGYNIKEQIYYSVEYPLNYIDQEGKEFPGYGRNLNDEKFQLLLLANPDVYETTPVNMGEPK